MKYKVTYIETTTKIIEVEAESMDEAYNIAEELYVSGEVEIDHNFNISEVEWTVKEQEEI